MLNIRTVTCQLGFEEIIYVSWTDYDPFMKVNFEMYFFNLIEYINRSGFTKLVLDCSCRRHDPSEHDFKEIYELFLSGLSVTKLEKMARICPTGTDSNAKFNDYLEEIKAELNLKFQLRNFKDSQAAFSWLQDENYEYAHETRKFA